MEISSYHGLKKTLKLARGKETLTSRGLSFGGFFYPWDEKISIPETRPIRKSYILNIAYIVSAAGIGQRTYRLEVVVISR
jgi:hypothetical protein